MSARSRLGARQGALRQRPWIRAVNAVLSAALVVLFFVHGVGNAFQLIGVGSPLHKALSHALVTAAVLHAVLGTWLTVQTLRTQREAGVAYPALNLRFWAVRISGAAVAVLMVFHVVVFWQGSGGPVRLTPFGPFELAMHILLVCALAVHVLANMAPLAVSCGIGAPRSRAVDAIFAFALLIAFMAAAFIIYYLRWSVI